MGFGGRTDAVMMLEGIAQPQQGHELTAKPKHQPGRHDDATQGNGRRR